MAQSKVKWTFQSKKITDNIYEIHLIAKVQSSWHIYSQHMKEGGPIPTKIIFESNSSIALLGNTKEKGNPVSRHEPVFNVDVKYYEDMVDFVQTVKLKTNVNTNITGAIKFMICSDDHCLPPTTIPFDLKLM